MLALYPVRLDDEKTTHLTKDDRNEIKALKDKGYSARAIAKTMERAASTIITELKLNSIDGIYDPTKAHHKATVRRKAAKFQGMTIVKEPALEKFIHKHLLKQQSPGAIAGRLAKGIDGLPPASRDTIERYIKSIHGRQLEYELKILKQKRKHSRKKRPKVTELKDRTFIDERPAIITSRARVGDVEADFIVSGKKGSGYLLTVVERKIRSGWIEKILPVTIANMEQAFFNVKKKFPELLSITTDNDLLFVHHKRLETLLGVPIYFCDPYSSWQKGSIENLNGQVRKYIPKGADISQYNETYIQFIVDRLNDRFMSVLGYKTPAECLCEYRADSKKNKTK